MVDSAFRRALYIEVVMVDPKTDRIEDKVERNTKTVVWLESGPWYSEQEMVDGGWPSSGKTGETSHDIKLDCGGDTFEVAIIDLAGLVMTNYGLKRR